MFVLWEKSYAAGDQSMDHIFDSVNITNIVIRKREDVPEYSRYKIHWRTDAEMQRHYWTASFLLPVGSIFILAIVILLMILFKKYPYMVAATVAGLLTVIIVFATLISLNHKPIYF